MTDVFFQGYGQWFGVEDDENGKHTIKSEHSAHFSGFFYLPHNAEVAYEQTGNLNGTMTLLPILDHPDNQLLMHYLNQDGRFAEQLFFRIDKSQPNEIVITKGRDIHKTDLTELERGTLLKIILGMAIDAYGYSLEASRNSATGCKNGISSKIATRGINVSDDTIRKYLDEAKQSYNLDSNKDAK